MSKETKTNVPPLVLTCPCGKTKIQSTAPPICACLCHCNECRILTQGISFESAVWPGGSFQVVQGKVDSRPRPDVKMTVHACSECSCMLYNTEAHNLDCVASSEIRRCNDGTLPQDVYKTTFHCWYKERLYDINDSLPKFADLSVGGTGQMMNSDGSIISEEAAGAET